MKNKGLLAIRVILAVNAYSVIKDLKLSDISDENLTKIWHDLKVLRPVAESYQKDVEAARKTLEDDTYKKMQHRAQKCVELDKKVEKGDAEKTDADRAEEVEVNKYFIAYNERGRKYFEDLANAEVSIELQKVPEKDILKVLQTNKLTFADMDKISIITE